MVDAGVLYRLYKRTLSNLIWYCKEANQKLEQAKTISYSFIIILSMIRNQGIVNGIRLVDFFVMTKFYRFENIRLHNWIYIFGFNVSTIVSSIVYV